MQTDRVPLLSSLIHVYHIKQTGHLFIKGLRQVTALLYYNIYTVSSVSRVGNDITVRIFFETVLKYIIAYAVALYKYFYYACNLTQNKKSSI